MLYLILLSPLIVQAQSNYKPGYVITLAGDTLQGYIDYQEWSQNPSDISFKATMAGGAEQEFDTKSTRYFEITGKEAYLLYEGAISMNASALSELAYNSSVAAESVAIFLKIHQQGKNVNFLSYTDRLKTRYFIQENDGSVPVELYYRRYYSAGTGSRQIITQKSFVGQLQHLAKKYETDSPKIRRRIESADYNQLDLEKIISFLNEKTDASEKATQNFRIYSGFVLSSNKATFGGRHPLSNADRSSSNISPGIVFGADVFVNKHVQKMALRLEATAAISDYTIENTQEHTRGARTNYSYTLSQKTIGVGPQLIYNFYNAENIKIHAGLTAQLRYSQYSDNTYISQYVHDNTKFSGKPTITANYMNIPPLWYAMGIRTGVALYGKYEVTAAYVFPSTVSSYTAFHLDLSSASVGVNYLFKR